MDTDFDRPVIYAVPDLQQAVDDIKERFGAEAAEGGRHPGQGTHYGLLALDPRTYLEVIAPDPEQPEPCAPRPYGVDAVTRAAVVGWALATDDIAAALTTARAKGFDPGDVVDGHGVTPTGRLLHWRLTNNALTARPVLFLISWGETPHPATSAPSGHKLESLHIEHPEPPSIQTALHALGAEVQVRPAPKVALVLRLRGPRGGDELR